MFHKGTRTSLINHQVSLQVAQPLGPVCQINQQYRDHNKTDPKRWGIPEIHGQVAKCFMN